MGRGMVVWIAAGCVGGGGEGVNVAGGGAGTPPTPIALVDSGAAVDTAEEGADARPASDDTAGFVDATTALPTGGEWLSQALEACTVNLLWLKDATGDVNGGPDLGSGYPAVDVIDGDQIVFVEDVLGMYSGGGIRGVLTLEAVLDAAGGAAVRGTIVGTEVTVEMESVLLGPDVPVLEDGVAQWPPGRAVLRRAGAADLPLSWGLVFSPTASAGNPVCAAAADAWWAQR